MIRRAPDQVVLVDEEADYVCDDATADRISQAHKADAAERLLRDANRSITDLRAILECSKPDSRVSEAEVRGVLDAADALSSKIQRRSP